MIILDTNVVSETMRPNMDASVRRWFGELAQKDICTTAITLAELRYGVELLPPGKRRQALAIQVEATLAQEFSARALPFDEAATPSYAKIVATRRSLGRPINPLDAQIAAIARARGAILATRNIRDFEGCGVELVDPWAV